MISEAVIAAVAAALAVILAAMVAGMVTIAVAVVRWKADNKRLWLWNRELVDHIYRGLPPPPPPPPATLFD